MTRRLLRRLEAVDARRRALLDEISALDPGTLERRPADGGWNLLEVVEHLVMAEVDVLGDLDAARERPSRRRTVRHRFGYLLVLAILGLGIPVKVPSQGMLPKGGRTLEELRAAWDDTHRRLRAYAASMDAESLRRAPFRHPVAGPLTLGQAVRMLEVHLRRHQGQIRRLLT